MPEGWEAEVAVLRESLVALPALVDGVAAERLQRAPAPGEWSAHVAVCHLVLNEMNTAVSLRCMLTQERPVLAEIEDDRCAALLAPTYPDTATALGVWRALREDTLRLCAALGPADLARVGRPPWSAEPVTVRACIASRGRHDRNHLAQIRAALAR